MASDRGHKSERKSGRAEGARANPSGKDESGKRDSGASHGTATADESAEHMHESAGSSGGPSVTETIRKLVTAGLSAAFMTEESIRSFVSELKLPKETLNLLLQGAAKSKEELMSRVSREVVGIISKIDFVREASRFVEEHKFKISAEIEVIRKDPVARKSETSGVESHPGGAQVQNPSPSEAVGMGSRPIARIETGETSVEVSMKAPTR